MSGYTVKPAINVASNTPHEWVKCYCCHENVNIGLVDYQHFISTSDKVTSFVCDNCYTAGRYREISGAMLISAKFSEVGIDISDDAHVNTTCQLCNATEVYKYDTAVHTYNNKYICNKCICTKYNKGIDFALAESRPNSIILMKSGLKYQPTCRRCYRSICNINEGYYFDDQNHKYLCKACFNRTGNPVTYTHITLTENDIRFAPGCAKCYGTTLFMRHDIITIANKQYVCNKCITNKIRERLAQPIVRK